MSLNLTSPQTGQMVAQELGRSLRAATDAASTLQALEDKGSTLQALWDKGTTFILLGQHSC